MAKFVAKKRKSTVSNRAFDFEGLHSIRVTHVYFYKPGELEQPLSPKVFLTTILHTYHLHASLVYNKLFQLSTNICKKGKKNPPMFAWEVRKYFFFHCVHQDAPLMPRPYSKIGCHRSSQQSTLVDIICLCR